MNTVVGWILAALVGAGVIWTLLFLMSLRRHTKRKAASAAAPVAPTSVTPVVAPPIAVLPTAPPAAAPTTTPPASNAPLPKQPLLWRTWQRLKVLMAIVLVPVAISFLLWIATWLASKTNEGGKELMTSAKEALTTSLYWLLGGALLVLVGWLIWKWFRGRSAVTPPPSPPPPQSPGFWAMLWNPIGALLRWIWGVTRWMSIRAIWLAIIIGLGYGLLWFADHYKWSNGMTLVQTSIAMSPAPAPSPEVWRYTEQEAASGRLIWKTDNVRILERVRGQEPRFMFSVPSPYQGITSHSRYEWNQRLPEGIVENRERNVRLRFVGNFISDILFTGSYTANGQTYTFRLEHVR